MSVYLIAQVSVDDPEYYKNYTKLSGPLIKKFGGKFVVRGGDTETLEGKEFNKRVVVVEFPDAETVKAFYNSNEYQDAAKIRQRCSEAQFIIVDGA